MRRAARLALLGGAAALAQACALVPHHQEPAPERAKLLPLTYADIEPALASAQDVGGFLMAFGHACEVPRGTAPEFAEACAVLKKETPKAEKEREFLTREFCPYRIDEPAPALFTGYYTGLIQADLVPSETYRYPIYAKPSDFKEGEPYDERSVIASAGLEGRAQVLAYAADPVDLFFMQIQGSGTVQFPDGATRMVAFAAKNGRPYVAVGKIMIERGLLTKEETNGKSIRAWLKAHPDQAGALMNENPSFVFFKWSDESQPRGSTGALLTPEHSLAADLTKIPAGAPVLIETRRTRDGLWPERFVRLAVVQDTGSAIRGAKRFDVYFGPGSEAEQYADHQNEGGEAIVFFPSQGKPCGKQTFSWLPRLPFTGK